MKYVIIGISKDNIERRTSIVSSIYRQYYIKPLKEQMMNAIRISITKKYKGCASSFYGNCFEDLVMIERTIENLSDKEISKIEYEMYPSELFAEPKYAKYESEMNIKPHSVIRVGNSQGWKYNQFIDEDRIWMNTKGSEILTKPTKLTFADGSEINLDEYGYLMNTNNLPSISELIDFGKKNSLHGADSIENWINEQ